MSYRPLGQAFPYPPPHRPMSMPPPPGNQNHAPPPPTGKYSNGRTPQEEGGGYPPGLRERGNDTSKSTGRSGRQNAATRRNMRREERVTVQGPVKEQQPDGMSHRGVPPPPLDPPPPQTKGTIVGRNEIYRWETLVRPFLVHKFGLGPRPPHTILRPPPQN